MKIKNKYNILFMNHLNFVFILFFCLGSKQYADEDIQVENHPFPTYISGSGIVEPRSGNIIIGSTSSRIVEKIHFFVNDHVKKGEVLFQLYNEDLKANLKVKEKKYEASISNLRRLESLPQEEDLIIAQETLNKAKAVFCQSKIEAKYRGKNKKERCILHQQALADFLVAQAQFEKVRSGASQPELKIARYESQQAKAEFEMAEAELKQTYVKAPIDGSILQVKIHEGEVLDQGKTAMILGNIDELNLRVSIDQFNASRFHPDCSARAFKQSDTATEFPLKFLRVEPLMLPKKYLTNELQEKVDTQIIEVIYRIEKKDSYLFIGEQMDVYVYEEDCLK